MTNSRASRSAMGRRPLAVLLGLLALAALGECLNCGVCIPPVNANDDKASQKEALRMRAKIARTFDNRAESDFQECGSTDPSKQPAESGCPWKRNQTHEVFCVDIKHANWQALTCAAIHLDDSIACHQEGDVNICVCSTDFCNNANLGSAATASSATISTVLVSALFGVVLATAW